MAEESSPWICERCGEPNNGELCKNCGDTRPFNLGNIPQAGSMRSITGWAPWDPLFGKMLRPFIWIVFVFFGIFLLQILANLVWPN